MRFFRNLSIKWKLTLIILVTSATPLLLCGIALVVYENITFKRWMVRELSTQADIIGSNNIGNLAFFSIGIDTKDDAAATLKSLQVNPHILSAGIYSQQGDILAAYHYNSATGSLPSEPLQNAHEFKDDALVLFKPIVQDGEIIGTVYIKSDLHELYSRREQYIGILAIFLLGSFGVALVLSTILQSFISKPILRLAQIARIVSEKEDYSVRAEKESDDEVGVLFTAFNEMLTQIQHRDSELMQATEDLKKSREQLEDYSHNLEQRVEARTRELQQKNDELDKTVQKLKETQNQIILQEKMASLGALTAGIAHEIKNPLNFVNNFSELSIEITQELREDLKKYSSQAENGFNVEEIETLIDDLERNAKKINEHGKRADSIVHSMLQHSRGKPGERELTDINALLDQAMNLTYHGMRSQNKTFNVTIEKDYGKIGLVDVIPQDLSRVFLNIINNGCYAAHKKKTESGGGFLPKILLRTTKLENEIEIRIRDNGTGIPKSEREQIFHPFFTTKPIGSGTGLGLSISYDIITKGHNGKLEVETEEGEFTEFIIRLPNG